mmetsp:Transcript_55988/g.130904  ORF Transcript_55988/g.130904 Transcript_55988/m.130904 type:complete len:445 (+) Transcript_55988:132-1466(+)
MRHYQSGRWGFSLLWGIYASVYPKAMLMAVPNAMLTYGVAQVFVSMKAEEGHQMDKRTVETIMLLEAIFTAVMIYILTMRVQIAYDRWWEGGTLLQKTRGEWFNAYSSLIAFSSGKAEMQSKVKEFHHLLARLMSLLFCCALQQVSPEKQRSFEIFHVGGIEQASLEYLQLIRDKEEVIQQWIQRVVVLRMYDGVLPVPPPVISRVFQEMSRGIVNLQNARKIADFPFPYPLAQVSMLLLVIHWSLMPFISSMLLLPLNGAGMSFAVTFSVWCVHFTALQLESPFGDEPNDLPMDQMMADYNQSLQTLLGARAQRPPDYIFHPGRSRNTILAPDDVKSSRKSRTVRSRSASASSEEDDKRPPRLPTCFYAEEPDAEDGEHSDGSGPSFEQDLREDSGDPQDLHDGSEEPRLDDFPTLADLSMEEVSGGTAPSALSSEDMSTFRT